MAIAIQVKKNFKIPKAFILNAVFKKKLTINNASSIFSTKYSIMILLNV
jgi:hypothetical protein